MFNEMRAWLHEVVVKGERLYTGTPALIVWQMLIDTHLWREFSVAAVPYLAPTLTMRAHYDTPAAVLDRVADWCEQDWDVDDQGNISFVDWSPERRRQEEASRQGWRDLARKWASEREEETTHE